MRRYHVALARSFCAGVLLLADIAATQAAGALAVGQCGSFGYAYDFARLEAARSAALGKCTGDCKVVTPMARNCAAFAIDGRNACGPFGYAAATQLGAAQNTALKQCCRFGGKDCVIRAWVCDGKG